MKRVYLDYAATTPTDPEVIQAMQPYFFEKFGNPSSIHSFGQEAKAAIEDARGKLASFLGAKPEEIVFTSGGSESNNYALYGVSTALKKKGDHIIISAIEHHAVFEPAKFLQENGFKVTVVGVDKSGLVDPADIKKAITEKTILISVMHANNEIGTIQPVAEIGEIARGKGIYFHSDAVQTVGHIPTKVDELNVDLLSLSAHKFYGPKGVGALYIRRGTRIETYLRGGDQERGRRASTHNTSGIVGLGKAIELCQMKMQEEAEKLFRKKNPNNSKLKMESNPLDRISDEVLSAKKSEPVVLKGRDAEKYQVLKKWIDDVKYTKANRRIGSGKK